MKKVSKAGQKASKTYANVAQSSDLAVSLMDLCFNHTRSHSQNTYTLDTVSSKHTE